MSQLWHLMSTVEGKQHRRSVYKRDYKVSTVKWPSYQLAGWSVACIEQVEF